MTSKSNETPQIAFTEQVQCASSQNASRSGAQGTALPTVIPAVKSSGSPRAGRTLVICLDGTGDTFNNDNSNVIKFVACLKKDDPSQITYYQSGIGTYDGQGQVKKGLSAAFDMAIGSGLGIHIKEAYSFLMQNYNEGDKICLLGFSRGSYTVRCLAGMLHKVGLLPAHNQAQVSFAYRIYKDDTPTGWELSADFKRTFCQDVTVYFVGVWDCVASVGFIPRMLPFSKSPTNTIAYFRHAMALDEHRAKFNVCQWQQQDPDANQNIIDNTPHAKFKAWKRRLFGRSKSSTSKVANENENASSSSKGDAVTKDKDCEKDEEQQKFASQFDSSDKALLGRGKTDVKEVWFAGCHCDVGGGAVPNTERHMLSRIPLRWMIRQTFECDTGILFLSERLGELGLDLETLWPIYKPPTKPIIGPSPGLSESYISRELPPLTKRTSLSLKKSKTVDVGKDQGADTSTNELLPPEQTQDHLDALSPLNDELVLARSWWILEFWPVKLHIQRKIHNTERWERRVGMNLGRHRAVTELEPKMHWTVQAKIDESPAGKGRKGGYRIRNRVDRDTVWRVVA